MIRLVPVALHTSTSAPLLSVLPIPPAAIQARGRKRPCRGRCAPGENFEKFMEAFKAKICSSNIATGRSYSAPTGRVARVNAEIDAEAPQLRCHAGGQYGSLDREMTQQGRIAAPDDLRRLRLFQLGAKSDGYWAAAQAIGVIPVYNKHTLPAWVYRQHPRPDPLCLEWLTRSRHSECRSACTQFNWN